jgi:hypothetical protein
MQVYGRGSVFFFFQSVQNLASLYTLATKTGYMWTIGLYDKDFNTSSLQTVTVTRICPMHHLWMCMGRMDKDPSILTLRSKWKWVVSYTLRLIYFQERVLGTQMKQYCCALEKICTWTRKIILWSGSQPWPFHQRMVAMYIIILPRDRSMYLLSHTNKCTNYITFYLKSVLIIDMKILSYFHSYYMFRHITCHPQGALMFLAKITGKTICKTW